MQKKGERKDKSKREISRNCINHREMCLVAELDCWIGDDTNH